MKGEIRMHARVEGEGRGGIVLCDTGRRMEYSSDLVSHFHKVG